mgnify:CR=1 FL=1
MEFDKTLLAGSTGLMLLKLLEQEDMYGYQMIETLRSRSGRTVRRGPSAPVLSPDGRRAQAAVREGSRMERLYAGGRKGVEGRCLRWLNRSNGIWKLPERRCAGSACAPR